MTSAINTFFTHVNGFFAKIFFADVLFFIEEMTFPVVVFVLFCAGLFLTAKMGFINIRLFKHAILMLLGTFDKGEQKKGEISHFKALTTALSATVGLGNIAGVAIAVSVGGPGAIFWMIIMGFLGMTVKFTECTLAVMFRKTRSDGKLMGGPMEYLSRGLAELNWPKAGKILAIVFSVLCIGGSFGGGVAFQVNQSLNAISISLPFLQDFKWLYAAFLIPFGGLSYTGRN